MPCKCNMCTHWWVLMYCIFTSGFCSYCVWNTLCSCHQDLLRMLHSPHCSISSIFILILFVVPLMVLPLDAVFIYLWQLWYHNFICLHLWGTYLLLGFSCSYRWIKSNANSFSLYFILQAIYGKLFSLMKFLRLVAFTYMIHAVYSIDQCICGTSYLPV